MHAIIVFVLGWIATVIFISAISGLLSFLLALTSGPLARVKFDTSMEIAKVSLGIGIVAGFLFYFFGPYLINQHALVSFIGSFIAHFVFYSDDLPQAIEQYLLWMSWGEISLYFCILFTCILQTYGVVRESRSRVKFEKQREKERHENHLRQVQRDEELRKAEEVEQEERRKADKKKQQEQRNIRMELESFCQSASNDELLQRANLQLSEYQDIYHLVKARNDGNQVVGRFFTKESLRDEIVKILKEQAREVNSTS